jgi:hypothetical protein
LVIPEPFADIGNYIIDTYFAARRALKIKHNRLRWFQPFKALLCNGIFHRP